MPEEPQPEETEGGALGTMATGLMQDDNFQKAMIEMAAPMIATQEAVLQKVIDSQNIGNDLLRQVLAKLGEMTK